MTEKIQTNFNITLSPEAAAVMLGSTSERKKGEWLSDIILRGAYGERSGEGILERIDARLTRMERQLAGLVEAKTA